LIVKDLHAVTALKTIKTHPFNWQICFIPQGVEQTADIGEVNLTPGRHLYFQNTVNMDNGQGLTMVALVEVLAKQLLTNGFDVHVNHTGLCAKKILSRFDPMEIFTIGYSSHFFEKFIDLRLRAAYNYAAYVEQRRQMMQGLGGFAGRMGSG